MSIKLEKKCPQAPSLLYALGAVLPALLALVTASLTGLPLQIPFLFAIFLAGFIGWRLGYSWSEVQAAALKGMSQCSLAIFILLLIGASIGIWISAGIIPAFIYYGFQWLSPKLFLLEACLLTFLLALITGSDAGAFGTVGIALLIMGQALNLPAPMIGGAITAGGVAGQLLSPLSDITVLSLSANGGRLSRLLQLLSGRVIPVFILSLSFYAVYGMLKASSMTTFLSPDLPATLNKMFTFSPWLFLPVIILFC
ncbi:Na+/H+ antiporter NhaC family protein [Thermanaeromonas toyohensis]|uniref:Na+/H+ antiporter NhaC family protein n=1 Tax=Thermanaeromonas toyohensis TaxID=161154 RepID=UPI0009FC3CEA|nr:Na+/H+ antiporter NhaC family protein [Thermanaeromonas toyohensis]